MAFHEFFLNVDFASTEKRIFDYCRRDAELSQGPDLRMRRRPDGVWELDPGQFNTYVTIKEATEYFIIDEVAYLDPKFNSPPLRNRVLPFFNYHVNRNDPGWRVVRTDGEDKVTIQEEVE